MGQTAYDDQETIITGEPKAAPAETHVHTGKGRKRIFTGFGVLMLFVLGFAIFMYFNVQTVIVKGRSMFDTFKTGDKVIVCRAYWLVGQIKDGDIVVITDPNEDGYIIKRVYRMGGETVDWKYIPDKYNSDQPYKVPPGMIYVLGDNLPESSDSRAFGPRKIEDVIGKVLTAGRVKKVVR